MNLTHTRVAIVGWMNSRRSGQSLLIGTIIVAYIGRFDPSRVFTSGPPIPIAPIGISLVLVGTLVWLKYSGRSIRSDFSDSNPMIRWLCVFVAWMMVSAVWAPYGARNLEASLWLLMLAVLTSLGIVLFSSSRTDPNPAIWKTMIAIGLLLLLTALVDGPDHQGRYSALGGGPNVFVRVMALGAIAATALASYQRRLWPFLFLPIFVIGAILSGSRGGLGALVVAMMFAVPYALTRTVKASPRTIAITITGMALTIAGAGLVFTDLVTRRYIQDTFLEFYPSVRLEILEHTLRLWRENPVIGTGVDGFFVVGSGHQHPHNIILAPAAEGGTIGLALILVAITVGVAAFIRGNRTLLSARFHALSALAIFLASLFSGDYYDTRFMWLFLGFAGVLVQRTNKKGSEELAWDR